MSTIARQPFAPLNQARLQRLTSLKNSQNGIPGSSPTKRKASEVAGLENLENQEPSFSPKRAKGTDSPFSPKESFIKPQTFFLSKPASTHGSVPAATRPRTMMTPKSVLSQLETLMAPASPLPASPLPASAGRSPIRSKRNGLSSRRRTGNSVSRIDPPASGYSASSQPISLNAALKGTIDYSGLHEPEMKSSWHFEIHEDTAEQEATNMLEHHACILDISSDEECENRRRRELEECKENVPPADDISQTSRPRPARFATCGDKMVVEKERSPLREMDPRDFYAHGFDENSVVLVSDDEDEVTQVINYSAPTQAGLEVDLFAELEPTEEEPYASAEELMQKDEYVPSVAEAETVDDATESFEVWESSSAKDEAEANAEC
ncbi:hypothetical protein F5Y14DRAFT_59817 [Nemania sp. NC0429]|nr:hypothetical protein F5Y14DRAFT_59817 [Nemania sp. NC0429]